MCQPASVKIDATRWTMKTLMEGVSPSCFFCICAPDVSVYDLTALTETNRAKAKANISQFSVVIVSGTYQHTHTYATVSIGLRP